MIMSALFVILTIYWIPSNVISYPSENKAVKGAPLTSTVDDLSNMDWIHEVEDFLNELNATAHDKDVNKALKILLSPRLLDTKRIEHSGDEEDFEFEDLINEDTSNKNARNSVSNDANESFQDFSELMSNTTDPSFQPRFLASVFGSFLNTASALRSFMQNPQTTSATEMQEIWESTL